LSFVVGGCETNLLFEIKNNDIVDHIYGVKNGNVVTGARTIKLVRVVLWVALRTCDEAATCYVVSKVSDGNDYPVPNQQPPMVRRLVMARLLI